MSPLPIIFFLFVNTYFLDSEKIPHSLCVQRLLTIAFFFLLWPSQSTATAAAETVAAETEEAAAGQEEGHDAATLYVEGGREGERGGGGGLGGTTHRFKRAVHLHELAVEAHVEVKVLFSHLLGQFESHGAILVVDPPLLLVQENGLGIVDLLELGGWVIEQESV